MFDFALTIKIRIVIILVLNAILLFITTLNSYELFPFINTSKNSFKLALHFELRRNLVHVLASFIALARLASDWECKDARFIYFVQLLVNKFFNNFLIYSPIC